MASIRERVLKDGTFVHDVAYRLPGGAPRKKTFRTRRDAERFKASVETDKARGALFDPALGRVLLGDYATRWLATRPNLRPRTRETYETQLRLHILPTFGRTPIGRITPGDVREWHASLCSTDLGRNTVAKCYRLLREILGAAVDDERIPRNPCKIKGGGVEHSAERPTATPEQVWALAELVPAHVRCLVLLAGFGNLRTSELLGLERHHINPLHQTISVTQGEHQLANGQLVLTEPKSRAGTRTFVLPSELMEEVCAHLEQFTAPEPGARVFTGAKGGPLRRHVLAKVWRNARAQVDLPDGFVFHDLRHTAQTLGGRAGATLADLKHRGGHSSVEAVMRYQHPTEDGDRRVAAQMDEILREAKPKRAMNASCDGFPDRGEASPEPGAVSRAGPMPESGRRESNPRSQLGKLMFCR